MEQQVIVSHPRLGDLVHLKPALTALAVSEVYTVIYQTASRQDGAGLTFFDDPVYLRDLLEKNAPEVNLDVHPCTCHPAHEWLCTGCQDNETATQDFQELIEAILVDFRFNYDVWQTVFMFPNMHYEIVDPDHVLCRPVGSRDFYRTLNSNDMPAPAPVCNPFVRRQVWPETQQSYNAPNALPSTGPYIHRG